MQEATVHIAGLTKLDTMELKGKSGVKLEATAVPQGSHGEVTLFVAVFATSALATLAAYLLRKHGGESFDEVVEVHHPDGRIEKRSVKWRSTRSEAPEAEVVKQIRGVL